jgi:hypothetical protein
MNWENPHQEPSRFSFGWCVSVTILHFVVSIVLPFLAFGAAMNAFSSQHGDIKARVSAIELFHGYGRLARCFLPKLGASLLKKDSFFTCSFTQPSWVLRRGIWCRGNVDDKRLGTLQIAVPTSVRTGSSFDNGGLSDGSTIQNGARATTNGNIRQSLGQGRRTK